MTTPPEIEYRPIPDFPGYFATSDGRITGLRVEFLSPCPTRDGYPLVILMRGPWGARERMGRLVHFLVCCAFYGPQPTPEHEARHLDGDKLNCRIENLAWGTPKDNYQDRIAYGNEPIGARAANARLTTEQVLSIQKRLANKESAKKIAADMGVAFQSIYNIKNGLTWKKYLDEIAAI